MKAIVETSARIAEAAEHYAQQLEWVRDKRDAEILRWMLDEPEASRHLLNLLREGKGDKESFRTMIERLKRSKESIAKERAR